MMDETIGIKTAGRMQGVEPYSPPRHPAPVDLLLAGNEGRCPSTSALSELQSVGPDLLRRYPKAGRLEAMLANGLGVSAERLFVTAGGDDALGRICHAYLEEGREFILPEPSFEMLPRYARLAGGRVVSVPWIEGNYPLGQVISEIRPSTALIAVVSPNNPTGAVASMADLQRLSEAAPNALLVVDLAYVEYADEDFSQAALELPNAVVFRTLSKAWGLAGLRIGYAAGPAGVIRTLRAAGNPYPISGPSLRLAQQAIENEGAEVEGHVAAVRNARTRVVELIDELPSMKAFPSQGNFVLVQCPQPSWLRDAFASLGIAIRFFGDTAHLKDKVRITVPDSDEDLQRVTHALETACKPEAIIFDMDGVLAEVNASYRQAIIDTADQFGVTVSFDDISAIKAKGDANNDWDVSHRLIARAGKNVGFDSVKDVFERLYQGEDGRDGLWAKENLIPSLELLERLAEKLPLAIVTGRPRADAQRFLRHFELEKYFPVCVCMEDAKLKPDPAPTRLALEQLEVRRAWMIGDTPDDLRSAKGAGVIGLGFSGGLSSKADQPAFEQLMLESGAARVMKSLDELLSLLELF